MVVHGDTFSTVLGALIGRFLGAEVAHVEAGMRTGNIWHPMPEELNRRVVAKIATLHFAPTQHEVDHLRRERAKGPIVDTGANTVIDALRLAIDGDAPAIDLPAEFGLVTLHRFEMLRNGPVFTQTLEVLHEASPPCRSSCRPATPSATGSPSSAWATCSATASASSTSSPTRGSCRSWRARASS